MRKAKREVTEDPIMLRIMNALEESDLTAKELVDELNLSKNSYDNWKFGHSKSYMMHLDKIADLTSTSIDYLVRGKEMYTDVFTAQEKELLESYRELNKDRQEAIRRIVFDLAQLPQTAAE